MRIDNPTASYLAGVPNSAQTAFIATAIAVAILVVAVVAYVVVLRQRLLRLGSQLASQESEISKLAAELEAQALLTRQMSLDLEELRKRLLDHEETSRGEVPFWSLSAPVNLNRRGQILRLSRKGKSISEIAQDLNVAQGEVELLLKVHDLGQKNPTQEN